MAINWFKKAIAIRNFIWYTTCFQKCVSKIVSLFSDVISVIGNSDTNMWILKPVLALIISYSSYNYLSGVVTATRCTVRHSGNSRVSIQYGSLNEYLTSG